MLLASHTVLPMGFSANRANPKARTVIQQDRWDLSGRAQETASALPLIKERSSSEEDLQGTA